MILSHNLLLLLRIHTTFGTAEAKDGAGQVEKVAKEHLVSSHREPCSDHATSVLLFVVQLFSAK